MYCEGFWGEGVCTKDMNFCGEPTADFDEFASILRTYYEAHRETLADRHWFPGGREPDLTGGHADEFMLGMINEFRRIDGERLRQLAQIARA